MQQQEFKRVTLDTIGNGVASELFQRELDQVLKNIDDINTSPEDVRKIVLEVAIKPTETREMCMVQVRCKSSLAGVKTVASAFFMGREAGKPVAYANNPKQVEMDFKPNVVEMKDETGHA